MNSRNRWLSKSQVQTFLQCPYKWYLIYILKKEMKPSPAMERGRKIHEEIENFYENIQFTYVNEKPPQINPKVDMSNIQNFLDFEKKRIKSCVDKNGKFDLKYFKPLYQELKIKNKELMLRGIIDAVYINPKDDKLIVIDWKTGKYRPENISQYRFELALYKELLEKEKKVEVGYWGIYFVDADKLFFEKVKERSITNMYKVVEKVRKGIERGDYPCKIGFMCKWCEFKKYCKELR
ncbi:MAG: PD-(D/E)XK nuclease family protein [Candidatus Heimdallarchaeaceae archaeon]